MIWMYVLVVWIVGASVLGFGVAQLTYAALDRREVQRGR